MVEAKTPKSVLLSALSVEERKKLGQHCATRVMDLRGGMSSWLSARKRFEEQSRDDFSWRDTMDQSSPGEVNAIFREHNDSLNIVGGMADFVVARSIDDILGSESFFSMSPEGGKADKTLATGLQKHSEWKIRQSNVRSGLDDAIKKAICLGEGVLKIRWKKSVRHFERIAQVLWDKKRNRPMLTKDRDYIFDNDEIVDEKNEAGKTTARYPAKAPEMDLRNGSAFEWKEKIVADSETVYENVSCECMDHNDLVVSLVKGTLEECDFIGHLMDMSLFDIRDKYAPSEEILSVIKSCTKEAKSESNKPVSGRMEGPERDTSLQGMENPTVQLCEGYLDYIVKIGGQERVCRIMAVVALDSQELLYAEYLSNITPKGALPLVVVRAWKAAANRWYGRGIFEAYETAQTAIDRDYCSVAHRNRFHANPIKGVQKNALENVEYASDIKMTPGEGLVLKTDKTLKDAVQFLVMPDLDNRTMDLMNLRAQVTQLRGGVTNVSQGGVESLPQNSTATGVEAILNSGNVLSRLATAHLRESIEPAVALCIKLIYRHHNQAETFSYLEGDHPEVVTISPEDVANLEMNVRLTLTRFRNREMRENAKIAQDAFAQYLQFPPEDRESIRPFTVDVIRSVGFDDAEHIVPRPVPAGNMLPAPPAPPAPL